MFSVLLMVLVCLNGIARMGTKRNELRKIFNWTNGEFTWSTYINVPFKLLSTHRLLLLSMIFLRTFRDFFKDSPRKVASTLTWNVFRQKLNLKIICFVRFSRHLTNCCGEANK